MRNRSSSSQLRRQQSLDVRPKPASPPPILVETHCYMDLPNFCVAGSPEDLCDAIERRNWDKFRRWLRLLRPAGKIHFAAFAYSTPRWKRDLDDSANLIQAALHAQGIAESVEVVVLRKDVDTDLAIHAVNSTDKFFGEKTDNGNPAHLNFVLMSADGGYVSTLVALHAKYAERIAIHALATSTFRKNYAKYPWIQTTSWNHL